MGSGAHSTVYKCRCERLGDNWAVKILEKVLISSKMREAYFREINMLRKLEHPNIISIYEFFQDEERIYIITPLCKGPELFNEINRRKKLG